MVFAKLIGDNLYYRLARVDGPTIIGHRNSAAPICAMDCEPTHGMPMADGAGGAPQQPAMSVHDEALQHAKDSPVDVHLDRADPAQVSKCHVALLFDAPSKGWHAVCLGATGMWVNDAFFPAHPSNRIPLQSGCKLSIGGQHFFYVAAMPPPTIITATTTYSMVPEPSPSACSSVNSSPTMGSRSPSPRGDLCSPSAALDMLGAVCTAEYLQTVARESSGRKRLRALSNPVISSPITRKKTPTATAPRIKAPSAAATAGGSAIGVVTRAQAHEGTAAALPKVEERSEPGAAMSGGHPRPGYSYAALIAQAIMSSPQNKLSLADICAWIQQSYPYYRTAHASWKNAIRHNLSVHKCFVRVARGPNEPGKGGLWSIDSNNAEWLIGAMTRRRSSPPTPRNGSSNATSTATTPNTLDTSSGSAGFPFVSMAGLNPEYNMRQTCAALVPPTPSAMDCTTPSQWNGSGSAVDFATPTPTPKASLGSMAEFPDFPTPDGDGSRKRKLGC